ncbi:XRE family transcriptional regulator [Streptomyces rochei]|uniref:XRE family transcriptional regulator n=1 Tax=Streptomyces rochei TaxID=1928 RepID=UPI002ACECEB8|nr:XRE family transcriptional regulator [Streptomyces rochei]WQC10396.1 XRE family transcriptional regulator [Streptomyces rochei]WQC17279.1 XRE family transcriptional regulator [Streptomyces rochei]
METTRNEALEAWMREHKYSANSLAKAVNAGLEALTGKPGTYDGRHIREWRAGRVRWPNTATRKVLADLSGRSPVDLGFVPRSRNSRTAVPQEDPMHRRTLVTGTVSIAVAAAAPGAVSTRKVGMSDVARLQEKFSAVIASDHKRGGQRDIEQRAAGLADTALNLQNSGSATQRVRSSLYATAASFRSSAMWAAIDGRRFKDAVTHMREAQALAELSGDQAIKFRIWSHAGTLYRHMGRPADARAANDVARNLHITRRDPMFASLGLARHMAIQGAAHEQRNLPRTFDHAREAMDRADPVASRPVWLLAFYDEAELHSLALSAYLAAGDWATAEYHAHRCLAALRPYMERSRAITTSRLAQAQLAQGDVDTATDTAMTVKAEAATQHPRVSRMLQEFGAALRAMAPGSSSAITWTEHTAAWRTHP